MFPSYHIARHIVAASIVISLVGMVNVPTLASTPQLKSVPTEAVGNPKELDDGARPTTKAEIHLSFALSNINKTALDEYAAGVTDKASPLYHKWLNAQQIGQKFGAPIGDITVVVNYLNSEGFSGVKVWPDHMFISAFGPRQTVENALSVEIHGYDRDTKHAAAGYSKTFYAPDRDPLMESSIAQRLQGIFGLSNEVQRVPALERAGARVPNLAADGSLFPSDLAQIYDTASLHTAGFEGKGETIAIFSPTTYMASDVTTFETSQNITGTTINVVNVNGGATDNMDQDEACLDIETIIGQAPAATVNVYEGPNDGSLDIFNQIETDDPDIVSESYGLGEDLVSAAFAASYETLREAMSTEGITIFVSSGDHGAYGDQTNPTVATVTVDSSSAYVTGVGGTELSPFITPDVWNGEVSWGYDDATAGNTWGSGGGLSVFYPEPTWQSGIGVANAFSNGFRQVPDVAACASSPYYEIYTEGAFAPFLGTSASCPLWASSFSLIEEELGIRYGCIDPNLYAIAASSPSVYHDITTGNSPTTGGDGIYPVTVGWDFVTGWGSADFGKLEIAFSPSVYSFEPGLQMISVPYSYPAIDTISELFSGLVNADGTPSTDVAVWVPAYQNYVFTPTPPADTLTPGQAYWAQFNATSGGSLKALGTAITQPYYGITLQPGWNMVGDPYKTAVAIDNLKVDDGTGTHPFATAVALGDISPNFYSYTPGFGYVSNTSGQTLTPYAGYWIYAAKNIQLTFYAQ